MGRLVTSVPAGHDRVAVLVLRQALATPAHERVLRTLAAFPEIAPDLVLALGALRFAVADSGPRDAAATLLAPERQRRTVGDVGFERKVALLVGGVAAVGAAVAHEEPADADSARAALEWDESASNIRLIFFIFISYDIIQRNQARPFHPPFSKWIHGGAWFQKMFLCTVVVR